MKTLVMLLILLFFNNSIFAIEYQVDRNKNNTVKFISDAPIEEFEGVTSSIDGYIKINSLKDLSENFIYFEVDLNTLDTGIGLRNRHMRDNYLETDKHQFTYFEGQFESIKNVSKNNFRVVVTGKMFIHGVTNNITIEGKFLKTNDGFRITSMFTVKLTDYEIEVPEMMFMKINETMKLELDFNIQLMEWCNA